MEATLRLLHCYSDSGITHAELNAGSNFSNDLSALQHTDIQHHSHLQVQLVFFEISVRYVKLLPDADVYVLAHSLFTHLQHHAQNNRPKNTYFDSIRSKFANLAVKLAEGLEMKSFMLLQFAEVLQGESSFCGINIFYAFPSIERCYIVNLRIYLDTETIKRWIN